MGRPRKANPTTNAERCKKYREKDLEASRANDALRKRLARLRAKQDLEKRKATLKKEAAAKRERRLQKKLLLEQNGKFFLYSQILCFIFFK